ncbi:radical SAM protein [bacterium]|nr:radical SAM protein [bacterium]
MKIVFISPAGAMHRYNGSFGKALHYAPMTMPTLAALIPPELNAEIKFYDETVEKIPLDIEADIICMTAITGTASRAYTYGDYFRKRGITVFLGGVHPSLCPDEARNHCDVLFRGLGDYTFPQALRDYKNGCLKSEYTDYENTSIAGRPLPRRDILKKNSYVTYNTMEIIRGCPHHCSFCAYPAAFGRNIIYRPIDDVINEMKTLKGDEVLFPDVNLISNIDYAKRLFTAMIPLKKKWFGLTTSAVVLDKELMSLLKKSGCRGLLIGFESINQKAQTFVNKGVNKTENYELLMKQLHDIGVTVNGCFAFGGDEDDKDVFEKTVEAVQKLKIDLPRYSIITPFPGTPFYNDLKAQNRIIETENAMYDVEHVCFQPKNMTVDELYQGIDWAWKETYKIGNIVERLGFKPDSLFFIKYATNFAYMHWAKKFKAYTKERLCDNSDIPTI